MKSQKGVTLISLTIYVIVKAIVVGILSVITTFFYHNTKDFRDINPMLEYTTFNSYFSDEVNHSNIKIVKCYTGTTDDEQNYIIFNNGVQYTYIPANKGIYRNKVKICRNIEQCEFSEKIEKGKTIITLTFKAEGGELKTIDYTLKD